MNRSLRNIENRDLLLKRFNDRDLFAFGEVYDILYNELHYFTASLYKKTDIVASDVIHDVFIHIWENSVQQFVGIDNLKAYLCISIKNKFKNYIARQKINERYNNSLKLESDNFVSIIVESETITVINQAIDLLPEECAKVFKMHLEGWQVKDIALELGKAESTVYAQKQEAVTILKKKLTRHSFSIISIFL